MWDSSEAVYLTTGTEGMIKHLAFRQTERKEYLVKYWYSVKISYTSKFN